MGYSIIRSLTMLLIITTSVTATDEKSDRILKDSLPTTRNAGYFYSRRTPHSFGYRFSDEKGSLQEREEETKPGGSKSGSYSYVDPSGIYRKVEYIADDRGFRATVRTNEPGVLEEDPANVRILKQPEVKHQSGSGNGYEMQNSFSDFSVVNVIQDESPYGFFSNNNNNRRVAGIRDPEEFNARYQVGKRPYGTEVYDERNVNGVQSYSTNTYSSSGSTSYFASEEMDDPTRSKTYYSLSGKHFGRSSSSYRDRSRFFESGSVGSTSGRTSRPAAGTKARRKRQRNYGSRINSIVKIHVPFGVQDSHLIPVYRDR